jgi:hypothetical protein
MSEIPMVNVHLPTMDGHTVMRSRYTEPEPDRALLLRLLKLYLPSQSPPKISSDGIAVAK